MKVAQLEEEIIPKLQEDIEVKNGKGGVAEWLRADQDEGRAAEGRHGEPERGAGEPGRGEPAVDCEVEWGEEYGVGKRRTRS